MSSNSDSTNDSKLPAFSSIKAFERKAIILKSEGHTMDVVTAHVNDMYALNYTADTLRSWFWAGGRLEQAWLEYNDHLSEVTLREARHAIKQHSLKAVNRLIKVVDKEGAEDRDAIRASATILNKYIPDKQLVLDKDNATDELPPAIANAGIAAALAEDEKNASDTKPDDATESPADSDPAGPASD